VRPTIRWKLMGSYFLIILMMGGTFAAYLFPSLERNLLEETRAGLVGETKLALLTAKREITDIRTDAPEVAADLARASRARVTIISAQGVVLGDSEVKPSELGELENHLNRPEVQDALKTGQGSSVRYSATLRMPMMYVAIPLQTADAQGGFLRLALPLSSLEKAKSGLNTILGLSLVLAALGSLVLSYILSNVTSRSLRTMAAIAGQIGKGEFGRRIPALGRDEVGELAMVMNDMAVRIESQLMSLSAEKSRLDIILRGMGEGVMVADATGKITLVNPAFRSLFCLQDEVEGKPLIEISRQPALYEAFRKVMETENGRMDEISLQLEREKTILTHWVPLVGNGQFRGTVAVFHDISDLKRLEKVRRDFVANVSHELRTPVTVIKGYAETLLAGVLEQDPLQASRFVEIILNHSERLASLIGDLLSLSEMESGDLKLELVPLLLASTVRRACALLEQKAEGKEITFVVNGIEEAPQVLADHGRIEQVMINLLDNAIKYTPALGTVTISAEDAGSLVKLSVTDTGSGIPPKDLPRIFERFYRVDAARSRDQGGTGLGLSIVKHIVQLHGGDVSVESMPGRGSRFSFTLKKA
jgi:two-component system, OmpR family, phosphate regulon sensor histidine kinase PhoR